MTESDPPVVTVVTQPASSGAFLAAVTSFGLAAAGIHLDSPAQRVAIAILLAAFAAPCWLAIGLHLASRSGAPTRRARALLVLSVAAATLLLVASAALLLFATHFAAALAFVAGCLVAGLALERGS